MITFFSGISCICKLCNPCVLPITATNQLLLKEFVIINIFSSLLYYCRRSRVIKIDRASLETHQLLSYNIFYLRLKEQNIFPNARIYRFIRNISRKLGLSIAKTINIKQPNSKSVIYSKYFKEQYFYPPDFLHLHKPRDEYNFNFRRVKTNFVVLRRRIWKFCLRRCECLIMGRGWEK